MHAYQPPTLTNPQCLPIPKSLFSICKLGYARNRVHQCTRTRMCAHGCALVHACEYAYIHMTGYVCVCVRAYMGECMRACVFCQASACESVCVCRRARACSCTNLNTHTQQQTCTQNYMDAFETTPSSYRTTHLHMPHPPSYSPLTTPPISNCQVFYFLPFLWSNSSLPCSIFQPRDFTRPIAAHLTVMPISFCHSDTKWWTTSITHETQETQQI